MPGLKAGNGACQHAVVDLRCGRVPRAAPRSLLEEPFDAQPFAEQCQARRGRRITGRQRGSVLLQARPASGRNELAVPRKLRAQRIVRLMVGTHGLQGFIEAARSQHARH